jgi:hypothetical protein
MRMIKTLSTVAALSFSAVTALQAQTYPKGGDPRDGLKAGRLDAGEAISGMKKVSFTGKPAAFDTARGLTFANSDLAFGGKYVYQGNFAGFSIWDVGDPAKPVLMSAVSCITSQGDPSVYGDLLFISAEGGGNRNDCGKGGVQDPKDHMAGVRIFDVKDPKNPKLVKNVQTCKGSHTHTIIPSKKDKNIIYIYVSGSGGARPETELAGCNNGTDPADENNSLFRLDVIKVPLKTPEKAEVITGARIFTGLDAAPQSAARTAAMAGRAGRAGAAGGAPPMPTGPRNCHDVTAYPEMNLLAGACGSYGLLVDVSNPEKPKRFDAKADTNFSLWHTAVFSNDGKKIIFTDEWGGGTQPMCQKSSMMEMGGNTALTIGADKKLTQHSYFKMPSAQSAQENCVSHNGGLIPVPGRDVMVQGWYQGGIDVIDFTDPDHQKEIAFFDRGPVDQPAGGADVPVTPAAAGGRGGARSTTGGSWGAYYWNGHIYSSEIDRGFDVLELTPSEHLSANEIAAAKLVTFKQYNPQSQPKMEWPAAFVVVRSYLDQLVRDNGLDAARTSAIDKALAAAEAQKGAARGASLRKLAAEVDKDVAGAKDGAKVKTMAGEIRRLAAVSK